MKQEAYKKERVIYSFTQENTYYFVMTALLVYSTFDYYFSNVGMVVLLVYS